MKTVLTPLAYGMRIFTADTIEFGITPWIGAAHVAVNELMEANITQIITSDPSQGWWGALKADLEAAGVKVAMWTKITDGRKRTVRMPIRKNCTPGDLAYYAALIKLDRERVA